MRSPRVTPGGWGLWTADQLQERSVSCAHSALRVK